MQKVYFIPILSKANELIFIEYLSCIFRRMFPVLSFGVHSLNFTDLYTMEVETVNSDNNRYKYVSVTGWRVNGVASQQEGNKRMFHPEGVQTGEYWQKNGVAFKRIKLTNKKTAKEGSNNVSRILLHFFNNNRNLFLFSNGNRQSFWTKVKLL